MFSFTEGNQDYIESKATDDMTSVELKDLEGMPDNSCIPKPPVESGLLEKKRSSDQEIVGVSVTGKGEHPNQVPLNAARFNDDESPVASHRGYVIDSKSSYSLLFSSLLFSSLLFSSLFFSSLIFSSLLFSSLSSWLSVNW